MKLTIAPYEWRTLRRALSDAVEWQESLADALTGHFPELADARQKRQRKRAEKNALRYRKLLIKVRQMK